MELKFSQSQKLTHLDLQILQIGPEMTPDDGQNPNPKPNFRAITIYRV